MITLYQHPMSAYVMKVRIALAEKGLAYEAVLPSGLADGTTAGEFVEASPRAEIPALVDDDGTEVFDSTIILEYIEDKWPEPPLLPRAPAARARCRMIEDVMDTHYEPNNWGTMEVVKARRATGELADRLVEFGRRNIAQLQEWLDAQLGEHDWFTGEQFGWADLSVVPCVARSTVAYGYGIERPGLRTWFDRVMARPSVRKAVDEMAQAYAALPDLPQLIAERKLKRQYRDHRLEWMIAGGGLSVVADGVADGTIRFSRLPR
ncbi:MAG: glutathione S-transferase family protein [Betaproteobacteria bacterium]|nr:glutathione S-transferase family protein [Betaproteobacteria bacterium]